MPDRPADNPAMETDFGPIQWFDPDAAVRHDGRNLPHLSQRDCAYFVTFRLRDSIPTDVLVELKAKRDHWFASNPEPHTPEQHRDLKQLYSAPLERYLDEGHGQCVLKQQDCRDELVHVLREHDGRTYRLGDYVIMPNHVHILVQAHYRHDLERICRRWTNLSAAKINRVLHRRGHLWQSEPFDHIIRNPARLAECRRYIQLNPRNLPPGYCTLGRGSLLSEPSYSSSTPTL